MSKMGFNHARAGRGAAVGPLRPIQEDCERGRDRAAGIHAFDHIDNIDARVCVIVLMRDHADERSWDRATVHRLLPTH